MYIPKYLTTKRIDVLIKHIKTVIRSIAKSEPIPITTSLTTHDIRFGNSDESILTRDIIREILGKIPKETLSEFNLTFSDDKDDGPRYYISASLRNSIVIIKTWLITQGLSCDEINGDPLNRQLNRLIVRGEYDKTVLKHIKDTQEIGIVTNTVRQYAKPLSISVPMIITNSMAIFELYSLVRHAILISLHRIKGTLYHIQISSLTILDYIKQLVRIYDYYAMILQVQIMLQSGYRTLDQYKIDLISQSMFREFDSIRYSMIDVYKTLCKELHVIYTKHSKQYKQAIPNDIMLNCDSFVPVHMRKKKKRHDNNEINPILTTPIGTSVIGDTSSSDKPKSKQPYPAPLTMNAFNTDSHTEVQLDNSFNDADNANDQYNSNAASDE